MSGDKDSNSIDAMIEDFTDTPEFHGLTSEDDFFEKAHLTPINYDSMVCIKTNITLHRDCTWDQITGKVGEAPNSIAVCPIAVYNQEHLATAEQLLSSKPAGSNIMPIFVRNAKADDAAIDAKCVELANLHNGMMVSAKMGDPSSIKLHEEVVNRLVAITMASDS